MSKGLRVGRISGIDIRVDWSWILIFLLITWNLSSAFSQIHSDWTAPLVWGSAIVAALLFFGSILAHELAHSLVAQARGMPVRSITLFLFGGVSNIQREPSSPGAEFFMAIVGPLTSILLGLILVVIAGATVGPVGDAVTDPNRAVSQLGPLTTLLAWLGSVNVLIGLFNMIPGFPLDGGRVLRSILWKLSDNLKRATRWASYVGQGIAWLMIGTGIAAVFGVQIPLIGAGPIGGLWLAFIGWFLNNSAVSSYRQVVIQDILEDVSVERMMRRQPPTVTPETSISSLIHDYVMGTDDHAFPVVTSGQLVGLVTLDDVRGVNREAWEQTRVDEIMTPAEDLVSVSPNDSAVEALEKLQQRDVRQLPVMRNGTLEGLVRRRDIITWLQLESDLFRV